MNDITLPDEDEPIETETVPVVYEPAHVSQNPLDLDPGLFRAALDRRRQNRDSLLNWIREQLKEGVDYGRIHVVGKAKCALGKDCPDPSHFSKPSLFKPGAEKIVGILGLSPRFPTLDQYEQAAIDGKTISQIILRCELLDTSGRVVGSGIGARTVAQDYGDLNKALKMAKKSAYIDASITSGGLSEEYTLDLEDMRTESDEGPYEPPQGSAPRPTPSEPPKPEPPKWPEEKCPCGSHTTLQKTSKKKGERPYITCDLAHKAFRGEEGAKSLIAAIERDRPTLKHLWKWA